MDMEEIEITAGSAVIVGRSLDEVLSTYDSDTHDKSLQFTGYKENMDGYWKVTLEDGMHVYYFERSK